MNDRTRSPSSPRPKRYYAIQSGMTYALRDAARLAHLPEGQLRRAILLDRLPAQEVTDDRQYLLTGAILKRYLQSIRPKEEAIYDSDEESVFWNLGVFFLISSIALSFILCFPERMTQVVERLRPPSSPPSIKVQRILPYPASSAVRR